MGQNLILEQKNPRTQYGKLRTKRGLNDRRASWETKDGQRERSQKTDKKEIEQKTAHG